MNMFKRWFGKSPPAESRDTAVVPPGHLLKTFAVAPDPEPSLHHLEGGSCLISLGHGSDEPLEELDDLLRQLEPLRVAPQRPVLLSLEEGHLSRLFAPADPAIRSIPRLLVWVFPTRCLDGWLADPARLQALLRRLHLLGNSAQAFAQSVYFEHDSGPGAAVLARLLAGLGLHVRVATPVPERSLLVEVHRPEGVVITALVGGAFPLEGAVDTSPASMNAAKDVLEAKGDTPGLRQLEQRERDFLSRALQPIQSELYRTPQVRAPRLCRLLRAAADEGGPLTRRELEQELLRRPLPLLLLMQPDRRSTFSAEFPEVGPVLRAYPDLLSLMRTARDLKLPQGSYLPAGMDVRGVFDWGAKQNLTVALNVYLAPDTPIYLKWSPQEARLMAQGQHATPAPPLP